GGRRAPRTPPPLMAGVERRFAEAAPHAELIVPDAPPVLGAALLALTELAAGDQPAENPGAVPVPTDGAAVGAARERLRAAYAKGRTPPDAGPRE
ncbi:hypothetical protein AB0J52_33900, partial [Spirillospora sp. NPDC049652]